MGNLISANYGERLIRDATLSSTGKVSKLTHAALKSTENSLRNRELNKSSGNALLKPRRFSFQTD